jgi:hypothetical protein
VTRSRPAGDILREVVLPRLEGVRKTGNGFEARCPSHDDTRASLNLAVGDKQPVVLDCKAGCEPSTVLDALGLTWADLTRQHQAPHGRADVGWIATYDYVDEHGTVLFQVLRGADKKFRQRRPDPASRGGWTWKLDSVRRVPYLLPDLIKAVAEGRHVYVVEGEKDVESLVSRGHTATCNPGGAGKWRSEYTDFFKGANVTVIRDKDAAGIKHAETVVEALSAVAKTVRLVEAAEGKDVTDHLNARREVTDLVYVAGHNPPAKRRLKLTRSSDIGLRPVRWAWDTTAEGEPPTSGGRLPAGSLCIAAGRAGLGKSQFAAWMASRITNGTLPGCYRGTPRSVIYAASEDSWEMTINPRLEAARADRTRVFRIDVEDDGDPHARLTLPTDIPALQDAIQEYDVALIVADPLLSMIDRQINDWRAAEVREALEPLVGVADQTRCLILGLAHFTKSAGSDPLLLISGSAAFGQVIRAAIGFARNDEDDDEGEPPPPFVLSTIKNNLGREDLPSLGYSIEPCTIATPEGDSYVSRIRFGGMARRSVRDIYSGANDTEEQSATTNAAEWIKGYLEHHGAQQPCGCYEADRKDIAKASKADGIAEATLDRGRKKAKVATERHGFGKGSLWRYTPSTSCELHSPHSSHARGRDANEGNEANLEVNGESNSDRDQPVVTQRDDPHGGLDLATDPGTLGDDDADEVVM